ncbi:MAG: PDZ domain-containing protein [Chloroflexi bacterium]|nr:PDZ domain-containing protein [Chloroflexota bacterium]
MRKLLAFFLTALILIAPIQPAKTHVSGANGVRLCLYIPGVSVLAQMPAEVVNAPTPAPFPTATPPASAAVNAETTARQLNTYRGLWNAVNDHYVYADFRGHDWNAIGARYEGLIQQGLSDNSFYAAMQAMLNELGDQHSYFQSPAEVAEDEAALASGQNFVGIGALFNPIPGTDHAAIMVVFPGSPAAEAGLLPHDSMLSVDGGPIRDERGISRTRGPEGSPVTVTIQRPGEPPYDVTLTRRRVSGALPIDYCRVPDTRIGYVFLPTLLDETIDDQLREALQAMTADGPLDGLVLDNRMNGGGLGSVATAILGFFAEGVQGYFVSREGEDPLQLQAEDIGGSQAVPLVVLVGVDTVSYGEIVSGVLRLSGRARIVGMPTLGNVEQLRRYDFEDGSRAWLASATFEPLGQSNGVWEETGIIPDVLVPTRWDLFTEANDPALAKAVEVLLSQ